MILPSLYDAALDRRLSDPARRVLILLHGRLDLVRFRPLKAWVVASTLGIKPHTAARALRELVSRGYLDAGELGARRVRSYRLVATLEMDPTRATDTVRPLARAAKSALDNGRPHAAY